MVALAIWFLTWGSIVHLVGMAFFTFVFYYGSKHPVHPAPEDCERDLSVRTKILLILCWELVPVGLDNVVIHKRYRPQHVR